jgi:NADH-quinone oxidoreductase subunit F
MDLHFRGGVASPEEHAALDETRPALVRGRRDLVLPALHAVHDAIGWLSPAAIDEIGRRLDVAPAEVFGVATFYAMFATTARPRRVTYVCEDLACTMGHHIELPAASEEHAVVASPCLGLCDHAPATLEMSGGEEVEASTARVDVVVGDRLLGRVGKLDPTNLSDYRARDGYTALAKAITMGPAAVIDAVSASGLLGRGGAAFPTGRKWAAVASQAETTRYVVCNADESEPGTFKDRALLEGDPFAVIEAMTIAGFATGATSGYVYLRGEYPRAAEIVGRAIDAAYDAGLLGQDVAGAGFAFDIEVRVGAGAYICGEETAIFNSIEGYRGEPRNKPPFPVEAGLFGRPTVVNNVETLACIPLILNGDGRETKLFCVSGAVTRPGVYEAPLGITLRELIALAGGVRVGATLQAVLLGGAAGSFAGPDDLDVELSFTALRAAGLTLGSGVVMVLDDTVDMGAFVQRIAAFFVDESCGQCVPCRVGTVRQHEAVVRLRSGADVATELGLLDEIGTAMRDASICGLGHTAYSALESAVSRLGVFRREQT